MALLFYFCAMRICIVYNAHPTGCSFYRLEMPNAYLGDNYTEFDYVCVDNIANVKNEDLQTVDVWLFNRLWCQGTLDQIRSVYKFLTAFGAKVILDLDDYWVLESGHIMYRQYLTTKLDEQIREHIRLADHVTTTTEHLAQKIRLLNKAVTILPNEPYKAYQQYIPDTTLEPDPHLFKIGWFGGAQHQEDIALVQHSFDLLAHDQFLDGRYRIYLGGYNENPVYHDYERMLSCGGKNANYGRIQAADIYSYVGGYNFINATIAPLRDTKFNKLKSELKVVEAGWMCKAIIASETIPYTDILVHGHNGLLIPYGKKDAWYKSVRKFVNEPEYAKSLAVQLSKDVRERFDIVKTAERRAELYRSIGRKL
jgi:glycosyltransferase involved in cell wall biosynthesis